MLDVHVLVLAKAPVPGRSKTRLCPPLTLDQAAEVARAALLDTLDTVQRAPVRERTVVLDGSPVGLVPAGFGVLPQRGDGLDERLAAAFEDAFADRSLPVLLIGMDTPHMTPAQLEQAAAALLRNDSVLGLATDGGWWVAGLHASDRDAFVGVPMSSPDTGAAQLARLRARGLDPELLPVLRDIDEVDDLYAAAASMAPSSRTARLAGELLTASVPS